MLIVFSSAQSFVVFSGIHSMVRFLYNLKLIFLLGFGKASKGSWMLLTLVWSRKPKFQFSKWEQNSRHASSN